MAKKLNSEERAEIIQIASWGVYHSGDVMAYNASVGCFQPVESFILQNIPEVDALMVIGGYPRPIVHAAKILKAYQDKYGKLPEFMTVGAGPNKGQVLVDSVNVLTEDALIMMGFNPDWVKKNHIHSEGNNTLATIAEIKQIVVHSVAMRFQNRPRIAVVTEPGYLLRLAQELSFYIPEYEFIYYETPVTKDKKRTFDCESFDGYGADIILACAWQSMHEWNEKRLPLTTEKMKSAPTVEQIRKFVGLGYCFYMTPEMLEELGYSDEEIYLMHETRYKEVLGVDASGLKVSQPMPDADTKVFMEKVSRLIAEVKK